MFIRYRGTSKDFEFTFSLKWFPREEAYFNANIWKAIWKFLLGVTCLARILLFPGFSRACLLPNCGWSEYSLNKNLYPDYVLRSPSMQQGPVLCGIWGNRSHKGIELCEVASWVWEQGSCGDTPVKTRLRLAHVRRRPRGLGDHQGSVQRLVCLKQNTTQVLRKSF